MTFHALVPQKAEPWERCFELSRMQDSQILLMFCPWTPLGRAYSDPHRLPSSTMVFLLARLVEKVALPKKLLDTALEPATLLKYELLEVYFSKLLSRFSLHIFFRKLWMAWNTSDCAEVNRIWVKNRCF